MEVQSFLNLVGGAVLCVLGWFARQLWEAVKTLQRDVHALEVDLPKSYVHKDDFNTTMKHIETMFQRIYDKLDAKVDKP